MKRKFVGDELDEITRLYDYGIVPGSATVFAKDELNNTASLDLIILENIMIVIEVSEEGFKIASCSPLSSTNQSMAALKTIQGHLEDTFDSMDNLLITISPMFREKFQQVLYDKLESVHRHQGSSDPKLIPFQPQPSTNDFLSELEISQDILNEIQNWM